MSKYHRAVLRFCGFSLDLRCKYMVFLRSIDVVWGVVLEMRVMVVVVDV